MEIDFRYEGENFEILAVSIDALGTKAVAPFMKKYNLGFPALMDPDGAIKILYQTTGDPESFIINKQGILVEKIIGLRDWATPAVVDFFGICSKHRLPEKHLISLTQKPLAASKSPER